MNRHVETLAQIPAAGIRARTQIARKSSELRGMWLATVVAPIYDNALYAVWRLRHRT